MTSAASPAHRLVESNTQRRWLVHLAPWKKKEPKKKKKVNLYEQMDKRKKRKKKDEEEEEEEESSSSEEEDPAAALDPDAPRPFVPKVVAISENSKAGKRALLEFEAPRERGAPLPIAAVAQLTMRIAQTGPTCSASPTTSSASSPTR